MKIITLFSLLLLLFITNDLSWAHPPGNIELELDSTRTVLSVKVGHKVNNPDKHFIVSLTVKLNDNEMIKQTFQRQDTKENTEVLYKLNNLKAGDRIEVTGQCNVTGKLKTTLIVPDEE